MVPVVLFQGPLARAYVYSVFLMTLPLYPAPLFALAGLHGRPLETITPISIARALGF